MCLLTAPVQCLLPGLLSPVCPASQIPSWCLQLPSSQPVTLEGRGVFKAASSLLISQAMLLAVFLLSSSVLTLGFKAGGGGLNESGSQRLIDFNAWSPGSNTV